MVTHSLPNLTKNNSVALVISMADSLEMPRTSGSSLHIFRIRATGKTRASSSIPSPSVPVALSGSGQRPASLSRCISRETRRRSSAARVSYSSRSVGLSADQSWPVARARTATPSPLCCCHFLSLLFKKDGIKIVRELLEKNYGSTQIKIKMNSWTNAK